MTTTKKQADGSRRRLLTGAAAPAFADEHHDLAGRGAHADDAPPWNSRSAGTGMGSGPGWLSFRRIAEIPFEACVAAL